MRRGEPKPGLGKKNRLIFLSILFAGFFISFVTSRALLMRKVEKLQLQFDQLAGKHLSSLKESSAEVFKPVYSLAGFFESAREIQSQSLEAYTGRLVKDSEVITSLNWLARVSTKKSVHHPVSTELKVGQALGDINFEGIQFPVQFFYGDYEPLRGIDLNLVANKNIKQTMFTALRSEEIVLTEPIHLNEKYGPFFMALRAVGSSRSIEETRGFVVGVYHVRKLLEFSLKNQSDLKENLHIVWKVSSLTPDVQYPSENSLQMSSWVKFVYLPVQSRDLELSVGNKVFVISYQPSIGFLEKAGTYIPFVGIFLIGMILTGLISIYILSLWQKNIKTEILVKERTESLEENQYFFSSIVENLPIGVFCKDVCDDFRYTVWNRALENITGISRVNALNKTDFDLFPAAQARLLRQADQELVNCGLGLDTSEEKVSNAEGELRIVSTNRLPVEDRHGRLKSLVGLAEDITERVTTQKALKETQERFALAIQGSHDGIWDWNISNNTVLCSEKFYHWLQIPIDTEISPDELYLKILPEDRFKFLRNLKAHLKKRRDFNVELRVNVGGDECHWFEVTGQAIWDENGKATRMAGALANIHPRKLAEEKLVQTSRLAGIGEMAAGVAHEINNPVTILIGRLDEIRAALKKKNLNLSYITEKLNSAYETTRRITRIVKALKSSSRNGMKDPKLPTNLHSIIQDSLALCSEKFRYNDIEVVQNDVPSYLEIECRPTEILQVFLNILCNAFDAFDLSREGNRISISVRDLGSEVEVRFKNNGQSIPLAERPRIFEPFYTTKEVGKGTGLGLSISRKIIDEHGGQLYLDEGEETCFVIRLPVSREKQAAA